MSDHMVRAEALAALAKVVANRGVDDYAISGVLCETVAKYTNLQGHICIFTDKELLAGLRRYLSEVEKETGK